MYLCSFFLVAGVSLKIGVALTQVHRATEWVVQGDESFLLLGQILAFCEQLNLVGCGKD